MRLNRDLLLGDIAVKYAGSSYSSAKVALAYDCIYIAEEWFNNPTGYPMTEGASKYRMKKDLKRYIKNHLNIDKHKRRNHGFIPSFLWWWIASAVVNWLVNRILSLYL
tara:strand:- start:252 stop:575 length:324 start_codon:yes stop_codon:yes gene_type:complete